MIRDEVLTLADRRVRGRVVAVREAAEIRGRVVWQHLGRAAAVEALHADAHEVISV